MKPEGGTWQPFIEGGKSLCRPTDLEFGPDGALWILGRIDPQDPVIARFFTDVLSLRNHRSQYSRTGLQARPATDGPGDPSYNLRIQALRILAFRIREQGIEKIAAGGRRATDPER